MFSSFMRSDIKPTDKLCFSLKLSAVGVIVVIESQNENSDLTFKSIYYEE